MYRPRYPLKLSDGEIVCPRKSGPFPAVVGAMTCLSLYRQSPEECEKVRCSKHIECSERGDHLRKHAEQAMNQMFPSKREEQSEAEDDAHDTP